MYDYHVEFCGFDVNTSEIRCEIVKTSKTGILSYTKFGSFAFNSCAIDFNFLVKLVASDKYLYYPGVVTFCPLDSSPACLEVIDSNMRSDIIEFCPKYCKFQNLHVSNYGVLFNKLTDKC